MCVYISISIYVVSSKNMEEKKSLKFATFASLSLLLPLLLLASGGVHCSSCDQTTMPLLGGVRDSPFSEIDGLARFAVDEHNKRENALLEFGRVVKGREQVVSGTMHHLTLEVIDAGEKKIYEAKVWVKPWLNFKELQEFTQTGDADTFTLSDLVVKEVPVHDPAVQEAAEHALKTIQQRSNSLFPYELREIVHAKAEVLDESVKFDLLLKVQRGAKEEKFKVEVHKKDDGAFHLNQMVQDHS